MKTRTVLIGAILIGLGMSACSKSEATVAMNAGGGGPPASVAGSAAISCTLPSALAGSCTTKDNNGANWVCTSYWGSATFKTPDVMNACKSMKGAFSPDQCPAAGAVAWCIRKPATGFSASVFYKGTVDGYRDTCARTNGTFCKP